jgi:GDPmannose 4,6-dehydratase
MWLMLQQPGADDYVLATGKNNSVREFCELAAAALDFDLAWEGDGSATTGIDQRTSKTIISVNPKFYRPAEVDVLLGDGSKARKELGWSPVTTLPEIVGMMAEADRRRIRAGQMLL